MKKAVKILRGKGVDSLVLSVELFNRPTDRGRVDSVLIFLDHGFEMLLKAAILHKGGRIRERRAKHTIGFDACLRKGLSDGAIKFLTEEQVLTMQAINSLRDAAQHHLLDLSEHSLYIHCQAGLTLFRDIFESVFGDNLCNHLPGRVLPLSTLPPTDLHTVFDNEIEAIRKLLLPGKRRGIDATARLRGLAILDKAIQGESSQPSQGVLTRLCDKLAEGIDWRELFPGVAAINLTTSGYGPSLTLRITKKEGVPIHIVPEGTLDASVVAVRRVDELGFYNLGHKELAKAVGMTAPMTTAYIKCLGIKGDAECHKEVVLGNSRFHRYSQKAISKIKEGITRHSQDDVWEQFGPRRK